MKMPKITIENHKKIYEYFREYDQNQKRIQRLYALSNFVCRPRVNYAKNAREDLDMIRDKDIHHIYVSNHRSDQDGIMWSSILHKIAPSDVGNIRTMLHSLCFESILPQLWIGLGCIPAFLKSYYGTSKKHKDHPERLAFVPDATKSMLDCFTTVMIKHHQKVFIFPEGAWNEGVPNTLLPIHKGTAIIAHRVAQADELVAITPIGFSYGKKKQRFDNPFNASVHIGRPIFVDATMTIDEITERIGTELLSSVKEAVKRY